MPSSFKEDDYVWKMWLRCRYLPDFSNKIIQKINLGPVMIYASGVILLIVGVFCWLLVLYFERSSPLHKPGVLQ